MFLKRSNMITSAIYYLHVLIFNVSGLNIQSSPCGVGSDMSIEPYNLSPKNHFKILSFFISIFQIS